LRGLPFVFPYLDDILIVSEDIIEHEQHEQQVFERLRKYRLTINVAKCELAVAELQFLGHIISKSGISPLSSKVDVIKNYSKPLLAKELKTFLAMINYYRKFIPNAMNSQIKLHSMIKGVTSYPHTEYTLRDRS
jgi:hypothetical protein